MQSQGGQLAAPDATRVQANDIGTNQQAQGRPVPEDYGVVLDSAARHIEPGHEPIGVMRWSSFMRELHMSVTVAHAHACKRIDDDAYALAAAEFIFPVHGLRSEEHTSETQSLMRISYAVFF